MPRARARSARTPAPPRRRVTPGPSSVDGEPRDAVRRARLDRRSGRARAGGRSRRGSRAPARAQRGRRERSPVPARRSPLRAGCAATSSSSRTASSGGAAASSRESASRSSASRASRCAVVLELRDQLVGRAVPREVGDVADERGQRRPQLVRGIGEEAPLRCRATVRAPPASRSASARAARPRRRPRAAAAGAAGRRSARSRRPRRRGDPAGASARRISSASAAAATAAATSAASKHEEVDVGERRVQVVRRRGDRHGTARGRAAGVGERRDVDAQVVAAELGRERTGRRRSRSRCAPSG